MGLGFRFEGVF